MSEAAPAERPDDRSLRRETELIALVRAALAAAELPEPRRATRRRAWREFRDALDRYGPKAS
jgi:hypothetical protein